jgi:hypothetical protein
MQTFEFHLDKKVTSWYRETHYVDAETLQQAQKIMIDKFLDGNTDDTFNYQEQIDDTWEEITTQENDNQPTKELWCEESKLLLIDNIVNQPMI